MKILITGSEGFVGQNLVKGLSKNHDVYTTDQLEKSIHPNYSKCDITSYDSVENVVRDVDTVIHLIAHSLVSSLDGSITNARVNIIGLLNLLEVCRKNYNQEIKLVRSDSAGWKKEIVDYCNKEKIGFTITTDQTEPVLEAIKSIPEEQWQRGIDKEGIKEEYEIAESVYFFGAKKRLVRLVAKRVRLKRQYDLFLSYSYWIVATNLRKEECDSQEVIHIHQGRGSMEKRIGELKHQLNINRLPCGQFDANCLYFTIGLLAYNLLQLLKLIGLPEEYHRKTVKTLRYQLIKLAGKVITHARYKILQIAAPLKNIELFKGAYYRIRFAPL